MELYKIIGGGHTWPGASYLIPGINTCQDFSASEEIWRFFSQFSLLDFPLAVEEQEEVTFSLFPNPVSNLLTIQTDSGENSVFTLVDLFGKELQEIRSGSQKELQVDLSGLSDGIYLIKNGNVLQKLVVTH